MYAQHSNGPEPLTCKHRLEAWRPCAQVDYYGAPTPIRQLAGLSVPESNMLVVQPYDRGSMDAVMRAIQSSDLGIMPSNDGNVIRIIVPQLTAVRSSCHVMSVCPDQEDTPCLTRFLAYAVTIISEWAVLIIGLFIALSHCLT